MYRCGVCGACSKPGQTRQVHTIYRDVPESIQTHVVKMRSDRERWKQVMTVKTPARKTIDREIDVCKDCKGYLDEGMTITQVTALMAKINAEEQQRIDEANGVVEKKRSKPDWTNGATSLRGSASKMK